jgi:hypothetical protein
MESPRAGSADRGENESKAEDNQSRKPPNESKAEDNQSRKPPNESKAEDNQSRKPQEVQEKPKLPKECIPVPRLEVPEGSGPSVSKTPKDQQIEGRLITRPHESGVGNVTKYERGTAADLERRQYEANMEANQKIIEGLGDAIEGKGNITKHYPPK